VLGSITPLGEWGRNQRWKVTVVFYVFGSALGGAAFGAALGAAGEPLTHALRRLSATGPLVALAIAILVGLALELHLLGVRLPTIRRQVSQDWLTAYRGWIYGLGFGFQLGLGVVTIVTTSAVYTTFVACFLSGSPIAGLIIGATFGTIRAATVFSVRGITTSEQLEQVEPALSRFEPPSRYAAHLVNAALVAVIAATAVVSLPSP
jgi:hypothetical protein